MKNLLPNPGVLLLFLALFAFPSLAEACIPCHDGSDPNAPNVTTYWNGDWWDANRSGSDTKQQGGHGDSEGAHVARTCDGATGCHDLTAATTHENGILETIDNPGVNTLHLRSEFMSPAPLNDWSVAETFNTACAELCHQVASPVVPICAGNGHARSSPIAYTPRMGVFGTPSDSDGSAGPRRVRYWVDSDISTEASWNDPDFALCITCHDPHGSDVMSLDAPENSSNSMIRVSYVPSDLLLCGVCHAASPGTPPVVPGPVTASDGDYADRINLTWENVEGEEGYRIYRAPAPGGPYSLIRTTGADLVTLDDPVACGIYYYSVTAYVDGFASAMSSADAGFIQGCGTSRSDIVFDFGASYGVWAFQNNDPAQWKNVTPSDPEIIAVGDLDGSGQDDVIFYLGAGSGVWAWYNNDPGGWVSVINADPEIITIGDFDGSGKDDAVFDFGAGSGVWVWYNNDPAGWSRITTLDVEALAVGDFDGSGQDDLLLDYGAAHGVWAWYNADPASWAGVTGLSPEIMAVGDLDGSGEDDAIFSFGAGGVWSWYNNDPGSWTPVSGLSPEIIVIGEIDGGGLDDVILDCGAGNGVWAWYNNDPASWGSISSLDPEDIAIGDLDSSGQGDVIFDYGGSNGVWVWSNNAPGSWSRLSLLDPESIAIGNIDGN